jgi:hypothetical protein
VILSADTRQFITPSSINVTSTKNWISKRYTTSHFLTEWHPSALYKYKNKKRGFKLMALLYSNKTILWGRIIIYEKTTHIFLLLSFGISEANAWTEVTLQYMYTQSHINRLILYVFILWQRLVNAFPLLDSRFLIMQQLDAVFSMLSMPICYKQGTKLVESNFCTRVCEDRAWAGGRGIATVRTVTRRRLVTDWEH